MTLMISSETCASVHVWSICPILLFRVVGARRGLRLGAGARRLGRPAHPFEAPYVNEPHNGFQHLCCLIYIRKLFNGRSTSGIPLFGSFQDRL